MAGFLYIIDTSWFNKTNYRYWTWIEKISQSGRYQPAFHMVIDTVKDCKKTCTDSGRGRLFIRSALSKKVLAVPVQQIVKDQQLLQVRPGVGKSEVIEYFENLEGAMPTGTVN
ncbi:hypothetical protein AM593_03975, partial [Mytilus galloprovincialis]